MNNNYKNDNVAMEDRVTSEGTPSQDPAQTQTKQKNGNSLFLNFLISAALTSSFAGMILDGGEVTKPAIIGTCIAGTIILIIVEVRGGKSGFTAWDRVLPLSPPILFVIFMFILPLVWRFRGLM